MAVAGKVEVLGGDSVLGEDKAANSAVSLLNRPRSSGTGPQCLTKAT